MQDNEKQVCLNISSTILLELDRYVLKLKNQYPKQHISRQKIVEESIIYYLKIKCGIPFISRLKEAKDEKV